MTDDQFKTVIGMLNTLTQCIVVLAARTPTGDRRLDRMIESRISQLQDDAKELGEETLK